jgi:hypothetical protein
MSCLYRALSSFHQGVGTEQMRNLLCDYLSTNPQLGGEQADKVVAWETKKSLSDYIGHMRSHHQWGGAIEIKAYCDLFNTNVKVISSPNRREIEFLSSKPNISNFNKISWNGSHYEPIVSTRNGHSLNNTRFSDNNNNNYNNNCYCVTCQRRRLRNRRGYYNR